MEETTLSVTGIILAAIIMFIVPLVMIADRNDDISQLLVENYTAEFVDKIVKTGKITNEDYEQYLISLGTSGNIYEVNMELKVLDENPARRYTNATGTTGENSYYSLFTSQIEEELNRNDKIILKEGDTISVTTNNSSKTLSQTLKNIYYTISGEDLHIISGTSSGTVAVNGAI